MAVHQSEHDTVESQVSIAIFIVSKHVNVPEIEHIVDAILTPAGFSNVQRLWSFASICPWILLSMLIKRFEIMLSRARSKRQRTLKPLRKETTSVNIHHGNFTFDRNKRVEIPNSFVEQLLLQLVYMERAASF